MSITGGGKEACDLFPWVHVVIANLKRFILGTHHWVSRKHLGRYVGEFCYRLNRRYHEADLFEHLIRACLAICPGYGGENELNLYSYHKKYGRIPLLVSGGRMPFY